MIFDEKSRGLYEIFVIYSPKPLISPEEFLKTTFSNFGEIKNMTKIIPEGEMTITSKGQTSIRFSIDGKILTHN